jgi:hypothetical protein
LLLLVTERGKERNWTVTLSYSIKCGNEGKKRRTRRKRRRKRKVKTNLNAKRRVKIEYSLSHNTETKMHQSVDIFYKKKL